MFARLVPGRYAQAERPVVTDVGKRPGWFKRLVSMFFGRKP